MPLKKGTKRKTIEEVERSDHPIKQVNETLALRQALLNGVMHKYTELIMMLKQMPFNQSQHEIGVGYSNLFTGMTVMKEVIMTQPVLLPDQTVS